VVERSHELEEQRVDHDELADRHLPRQHHRRRREEEDALTHRLRARAVP